MSSDNEGPAWPVGFIITVQAVNDDVRVVECSGELDLSTCAQLEEAVATIPHGDVIADLSGISFMDSSGVSTLVSSVRDLDEGGRKFIVVCPPGAPRRVINLTGLEELLQVCDTRSDAVALLTPR